MNIETAESTPLGDRKVNQDRACVVIGDSAVLLAVADGMGGHKGGELAAQAAIDSFVRSFKRERPLASNTREFLTSSIAEAHREVFAIGADVPFDHRPRTTIVLCIVADHRWIYPVVSSVDLKDFDQWILNPYVINHPYIWYIIDQNIPDLLGNYKSTAFFVDRCLNNSQSGYYIVNFPLPIKAESHLATALYIPTTLNTIIRLDMELKQIGRYEIKTLIGQGGKSTVYLGYDPRSLREVAIKVLPPYYMHAEKFRDRFEREAVMIALLEHPAIVTVYDMGEDEGQPYIVMRYMSERQGGRPEAPAGAVFPEDGALIDNSSPRFEWKPARGPKGVRIATYRFQLSRRPDCAWPLSPNFDREIREAESFQAPVGWLNRGTTYYWRVAAEDENGNLSPWSKVFSFTVK